MIKFKAFFKIENFSVRVERERPALYQVELSIIGTLSRPRPQLKAAIEKLGGKLVTKIHKNLFAILSTAKEVEKMNLRMQNAKFFGIHIVTEHFIDDIQELVQSGAIEYLKKNSICDWGTDVRIESYSIFKYLTYFSFLLQIIAFDVSAIVTITTGRNK